MLGRAPVKFCRNCGTATVRRVPDDGDTHERAVCPRCHTIHYENPLNVVGTIPVFDDGRILLCQRNIEPRRSLWTLPAGFMELGETLSGGARRETDEEAGADIEMGPLFSIISLPQIGQVHLFYRARLRSTHCRPGPETMQVALLHEAEIPWQQLAFRTVKITLERYFADRAARLLDAHRVHSVEMEF